MVKRSQYARLPFNSRPFDYSRWVGSKPLYQKGLKQGRGESRTFEEIFGVRDFQRTKPALACRMGFHVHWDYDALLALAEPRSLLHSMNPSSGLVRYLLRDYSVLAFNPESRKVDWVDAMDKASIQSYMKRVGWSSNEVRFIQAAHPSKTPRVSQEAKDAS